MTAEAIRTGRSIAAAKAGRPARTAMPIATGTRISAKTLRISLNGSDTSSPRS